jgi:hypothetical protein
MTSGQHFIFWETTTLFSLLTMADSTDVCPFSTAPICQVARSFTLLIVSTCEIILSVQSSSTTHFVHVTVSTKPTYETLPALAPLSGIIYLISKAASISRDMADHDADCPRY